MTVIALNEVLNNIITKYSNDNKLTEADIDQLLEIAVHLRTEVSRLQNRVREIDKELERI